MSAVADISEATGEAFDALRETLIGDSANLILLREDGTSAPFEVIATITSGWNSEYSEFFGNDTFNVADLTAEFGQKVRKTTHVVVTGADLPDLNNMLYKTQEGTAGPDADSPFWRIRAKSVGRRYVSADEI
jgi:hypothetical protein